MRPRKFSIYENGRPLSSTHIVPNLEFSYGYATVPYWRGNRIWCILALKPGIKFIIFPDSLIS